MASSSISRIAKQAAERLYEDERLRGNLTDGEAEIVLKWAADFLTRRIGSARAAAAAERIAQEDAKRMGEILTVLGSFDSPQPLTLEQAVAAVAPLLARDAPFTREEILSLLTALIGAAWDLRP